MLKNSPFYLCVETVYQRKRGLVFVPCSWPKSQVSECSELSVLSWAVINAVPKQWDRCTLLFLS